MGFFKLNAANAGRKRIYTLLTLSFIIGLIFYCAESMFIHFVNIKNREIAETMLTASRIMAQAIKEIRKCRLKTRGSFSPEDLNGTGLIGLDYSPITTTLGNLEAKRTTTNPNFAGLITLLLYEAGVEKGDAIAIGASSSFPALIVATLAAAKAMGVTPLLICSLGSSQWGANDPLFTWLEIEDCLIKSGLLPYQAIAISLGGDEDKGLELEASVRDALRSRISKSGKRFVEAPDLVSNVSQRIALYHQAANGKRISVFVNIGGAWANIGTDPIILRLKPGLNKTVPLPPVDRRGVLFAMAEEGIPVIHLLNIKELTIKYGLPWDPYPLPSPGEGLIYYKHNSIGLRRALAALGLVFMSLPFILYKRFDFPTK